MAENSTEIGFLQGWWFKCSPWQSFEKNQCIKYEILFGSPDRFLGENIAVKSKD